ncbi:MAG: hypothetical protein MI741_19665, partial [Rhodospirillales bacterium]|nr:hypothetical protein [Rhodospirillales bacterium]
MELLISLAITAMLLTATMVAIDASFKAYAAAAETASTQTATRMIVNRLLAMVRTSSAHGPLEAAEPTDADWVAMMNSLDAALQATYGESAPARTAAFSGQNLEANFLRMVDYKGNDIGLVYV